MKTGSTVCIVRYILVSDIFVLTIPVLLSRCDHDCYHSSYIHWSQSQARDTAGRRPTFAEDGIVNFRWYLAINDANIIPLPVPPRVHGQPMAHV